MLTGVDQSVTSTAVVCAVSTIAGYVFGSIPVANVVARRRGVTDLRAVGDRNPGYWNAKETLGRAAALPVFIGDLAKGAAAAAIATLLAADGQWWMAYVGTAAAMIGHAWPLFAHFRGGRSLLTFAGGICIAAPLSTAIAVLVLLMVFATTRSFALGARAGIIALPIAQLLIDGPYRTAATGGLMCIFGMRFVMAWRAAAHSATPHS